ncbi:MAG: hypothetical protein QM752_06955 [Gammaproteobacteria bacterium]
MVSIFQAPQPSKEAVARQRQSQKATFPSQLVMTLTNRLNSSLDDPNYEALGKLGLSIILKPVIDSFSYIQKRCRPLFVNTPELNNKWNKAAG